MFNIVIFGPPGSGKGTQSARVAGRYNLDHISTGDILRTELNEGTEVGQKARKFIDNGLLVPDSVILKRLYKLVPKYINTKGLIFDGFPRTLHQAVMLDKFLLKYNISLNIVIFIEVKAFELFRRMMGRAVDSGRSDDKESVIKKRLKIYRTYTQPLIDYYRNQQKLVCISGMAPVDEVSGRLNDTIEQYIFKNGIIL